MMHREGVGARAADTSLPELLEQSWRGASAALSALRARLRWRRRAAIRVRNVSDEWLSGHAAESGKHRDNR